MTQKMIRKRDGRLVEFHTEKIRNAIWRSFLGVGQTGMEDVSDALARKVETMLELEGCEPEVEHVQDLVEQVLMQEGYGRTAKAYILYREERSRARQVNSSLMRKFEEITFKDAADSDIKRENANINGDTAAGKLASALGAEKLVILTDIEGLCNDIKIRDVISYLNIEDVKALKDKGTIAGGMIPKVDCCVQAIEEGVTSVNIIDGRKPHSVLYEAFTNEGTGTTIGTAQPSVGIKW